MSFFRRLRRGGLTPSGTSSGRERRGPGAPGAADPSERVRLRSLALGSLFSQLVPGGAYEFLDLGPAVGPNVEFLSRYGRGVRVGDLWETMNGRETAGGDRLERALEPLVADDGPGYHAILVWDLLNYLSEEELETAARTLARALRPGGYLFAVIHYAAQMPAEPLRYTIADRETLTYREPETRRPAPRYPQRTLERAFRDLALEHAYLLKSGLQEYLFVRE